MTQKMNRTLGISWYGGYALVDRNGKTRIYKSPSLSSFRRVCALLRRRAAYLEASL